MITADFTVKGILKAIDQAIKQFGTYTWGDKGPNEVMLIHEYVNHFMTLEPDVLGPLLVEVGKKGKKDRGEDFVRCIMVEIQEYPKWDELCEKYPALQNAYDGQNMFE